MHHRWNQAPLVRPRILNAGPDGPGRRAAYEVREEEPDDLLAVVCTVWCALMLVVVLAAALASMGAL